MTDAAVASAQWTERLDPPVGGQDHLGLSSVSSDRILPKLSLPRLWAETSDAGRHAIAEAVFEQIDVLGVTDYTFTLTAQAKARGWDAAFGAGVVRAKEGRSGRGERDSPATNDLPITMRLAEPPEPVELVRSA